MAGKLYIRVLKYGTDLSIPKGHQAAMPVAFVPFIEICLHKNSTMAMVQHIQCAYCKL